ncbi:hypothetical protein DASC09_041000 [Saccharomycopsis crataegensis]|uniref:DRBM domain-containing protein n=1 Tax=Saccharomycopsis crataegensis TaxID=43959 RepID=A0AAV5QPC7_9ASCO|nr:hypothetical protein DASC09_041000 [Saccharomycopsis crataegensis]
MEQVTLQKLVEMSVYADQVHHSVSQLLHTAVDRTVLKEWKEYYKLSDKNHAADTMVPLLDTAQIKLASRLKRIAVEEPDNILNQIAQFNLANNDFNAKFNKNVKHGNGFSKPQLLAITSPRLSISAFFHPSIVEKITNSTGQFDKPTLEKFYRYQEEHKKLNILGYQFINFITILIIQEKYPKLSQKLTIEKQSQVFNSQYFNQLALDYNLHIKSSQLFDLIKLNQVEKFPVASSSSSSSSFITGELFDNLERNELYTDTFYAYIGALLSENYANSASIKIWLSILFSIKVGDGITTTIPTIPSTFPEIRETRTHTNNNPSFKKRVEYYKSQLLLKGLKTTMALKTTTRPFKVVCLIGEDVMTTDFGNTIAEAENNCLHSLFDNPQKVDGLVKNYHLRKYSGGDEKDDDDDDDDDILVNENNKRKKTRPSNNLDSDSSSGSSKNGDDMDIRMYNTSITPTVTESHLSSEGGQTASTGVSLGDVYGFATMRGASPYYGYDAPGILSSTIPSGVHQGMPQQFFGNTVPPANYLHNPQNNPNYLHNPQNNPYNQFHHQQQQPVPPSKPDPHDTPIDHSAKNTLYALVGQQRLVPEYKFTTLSQKKTVAKVFVDGVFLGQGIDNNKKLASQRAAMMALENVSVLSALGIDNNNNKKKKK